MAFCDWPPISVCYVVVPGELSTFLGCLFAAGCLTRFPLPCVFQYSKAVDFGALEKGGGKVMTCVFKDDGRVLSVFAKRARGLFARHVVEHRATGVADLEAFSSEGYRLDRSQCDDGVLVFSRSKAQRTAWQAQETGRTVAGKKRTAPAAGLANAVGAGSGPKSEEVKAGKKSSKKGGTKTSKAKSK